MTDPAGLVREAWRRSPAPEQFERAAAVLRVPVWVVGGAVRDALLGRSVEDWDLATPQAGLLAEAVAAAAGAQLVVLHEDTQTYRLVMPGDRAVHYDLVALRAPDIEADLGARDFSLNAIAYDLQRNQLLDPCRGRDDLEAGVLRALAQTNLHADPLRCLRAYRLHSQFGFAVEPMTREWLRMVAPELARVPGERVGAEMLKLLHPPRATAALRLMDEDGVLAVVLPEIDPMRGVDQGGYHHLDVWGHTLEVVANLERLLLDPGQSLPRSQLAVEEYLSRREMPATLLLTALLHDVAKPGCRHRDERGGWRFFDHDRAGAQMARLIARRLRLRREVADTTTRLIHNHLRPLQLANLQLPDPPAQPQEITMSALRRLFRETHPDGTGLLLLGLADAQGCRGPAARVGYHERLAAVLDEMLVRYRHWRDEQPHRPLLTGQDLLDAGYCAGPAFGEVLAAVEDAHADELLQTRQEALEYAARQFARLEEDVPLETK